MTPDGLHLTRRHAMAAAAMAGLAAAVPAAAQGVTATGFVFEDAGAGTRGPGVPGIMVSNGRDVVKTGPDGAYSLPVQDGDSVFVIKPAGWMTPVDPETQLPRFAHVHAPGGSPELGFRFRGLAPTGPLPASLDFPLRRQAEAADFDAILFTDPQPESLAELGYIRDDVVAGTAGTQAAFGISLGDLMFDDLSHYDRYNRIVGTVGLPWYNCCGNHDMNLEAPDDVHSRDTFKRVFGARHHAFQYGPATFVLLDNVEYMGTDASKPNGFGQYRGHFGPEQLGFLRAVLANVPGDAPIVVCFHIPLRTRLATDPANMNTDTADFLAAMAGHPNSISLSGHTHTNEHWYLGPDGQPQAGGHHHHVLTAVSGSWWSGPFDVRGIPVALASDGTPNGSHVLSVRDGKASTRLVPAHDPQRGQLRIMLDSQVHRGDREVLNEYAPGALLTGPLSQEATGAARLVVNLFDGGPTSTVEFTVGAGAAVKMKATPRTDPFVEEVYARNEATKKPWVKPSVSTHIWQATLPQDLPRGTHRIAVRATDEHGRPHEASMVLEVT